jgi:hypothetical protein
MACGTSVQPAQAAKELTKLFRIGILAAAFLHLKIVPVEEGRELRGILALHSGLKFAKLANLGFKLADSLLKQISLVVGQRRGGGWRISRVREAGGRLDRDLPGIV